MAILTLRSVKGSPLTNAEADQNFINLNDDKVEVSLISIPSVANTLVTRDDDGIIFVHGISSAGNVNVTGTVNATNFSGNGAALTNLNATNLASGNIPASVMLGGASTITELDLTASRALVSNNNGKVAVSAVTAVELSYLTGAASSIQTQLNGKQATITGAATSVTSSNLTASRALISDGSGKISNSSVTSTELAYLSGVTSSIQTQLNAKVTNTFTASRALITNGSGNVAVSTVTSTEVGYLSGVTSGIQPQLNARVLLAGSAMTGRLINSGDYGTFATIGFNQGQIEVRSATAASNGAFIAFLRPALFGAYFGLDTDDKFKIGGWSLGASYNVHHDGVPIAGIVTVMGTNDMNLNLSNAFTRTVNANTEFTFSNIPSSRAIAWTLRLTHTSGTLTFPASVKWSNDTPPVFSTGKTHLIMFYTDNGGSTVYASTLANYT